MDETTFQRELILLKDRVSQMAASYQQRLPPRPSYLSYGGDAFGEHLQDVKDRLSHMQESLDCLYSTQNRPRYPHLAYGPPPTSSTMPDYVPQNRLALPTGPLFWQLFTSLRTDVRGLSSRVSDLEQNVSDLEDRVDHIDPRFTPPASDANVCDFMASAQQPYCPATLERVFGGDWAPGHARQKPSELDAAFQPTHVAAVAGFGSEPTLPFQASNNDEPRAPEGVAFRDKEIMRLEELMRGNQEDLQMSEEVLRRKDAEIEQFRSENGQLRARIDELEFNVSDREGSLAAYSGILDQKQNEIESLQSECSSQLQQLTAWDAKNYNIKQNYLRKKTQLATADLEVQQLQHALHRKQEEVDDTINSKDEEIYRLREFCDSKDAVVRQQEDIIARGATLIQDRDHELERVTRELKILRDDYENECRERERCSRLFEERGEVIAELRASLDDAYREADVTESEARVPDQIEPEVPLPETSVEGVYAPEPEEFVVPRGVVEQQLGRRSPAHEHTRPHSPYTPLSFANVGKNPVASNERKWSPQPIKGNVRTFSEQQRASLWQSGPSSTQRQFGVPGYVQEDRASDKHKRDLRRSDSVRLLRRLALAEEGTAKQPTQHVTGREYDRERAHSRSKRVLPLDDLSFRPPLPAPTLPPLPPRRHGSHADLGTRPQRHSRQLQDDSKPISKHMSMQDLNNPRRRLHAYVEEGVEAEAEGSGERSDV